MLFYHIQFHNFLTFKGTQTLEFPDPTSTNHALMLVLGANTAGKTSIIRALRFLFCDDPLNHPNDPEKLINDGAASEAKPNEKVSGWVQVKVVSPSGGKTIRRRIETRCVHPGTLKFTEKVLEEQRHERAGDKFATDQGTIQRSLSLMVPPELFDYFFFEGESLAEKLVGGKSSQGIKDGLATLIQDHQWEDAIKGVRAAEHKIDLDLQRFANQHKEYKAMVDRLESINSQLSITSEEKTKHTSKKAEAERTYAECESEIQELSKGQSFEVLNKDLQSARAQFGAAGKSIDDIDKEIGRLIGVSHGLPFFADAFEDALQQLAIMRRENILPADVSEGFVNRLLDWPQTQICICGRSLDPGAHEDQRKCIEDYRNRTMAVDLNHALLSLVNSLESGTVRGFKVRADATVTGLTIAIKGREQAVISQLDSQTRVSALEEKRQKLSVEKIQQLQKSQRAANEARIDSERYLKEIEINLKRLEFEHGKLNSEINGLQKSGKASEINKLLNSKKQAQELVAFIQEARAALKNTFHSKLQALVSQYYDPVAPDDSKAHVDKSTLLPSIRVDGEVRKNIGGASRQLLVLSHIVSLAQLRKWLHDELKEVGINPGNIDEHCFVLDSVFGPVADEFREKCAEFLVGKARQVMVLVAAQQWDETVRTRLENSANKIYRLVRCTNKTDIKPEERTMKFRKKDIEVFRQVGPKVKSFTIAEEVKL